MARRSRMRRRVFRRRAGTRLRRSVVRNYKRRLGRRGRLGRSTQVHKYIREQQVTLFNDETTIPDTMCKSSNPAVWANGTQIAGADTFQPYPNRVTAMGGVKTFYANDSVATSEFAALYDYYKLLKVELLFEYKHNVVAASDIAASVMPTIHIVQDLDGDPGVGLLSLNDMLQHGTSHFKRRLGSSSVRYVIKPKLRQAVSAGVGLSIPMPMNKSPWLDTGRMDIPMNGLKWILQDWPMYQTVDAPGVDADVTEPTLRITMRYHYLFKGVQ